MLAQDPSTGAQGDATVPVRRAAADAPMVRWGVTRSDATSELEADDQGADQDQPGVGYQVRIIGLHLNPVQRVRYSAH